MHVGPTELLAHPGEPEISSKTILDGLDIQQRLPIARLPVVPQVLSRLYDACFANTVGSDEIAAIVSLDPGIAAQVINVASSSATNECERPSNLNQCVKLVGMHVIKTIAVNESATRVFGRLNGGQECALSRYWFRSLKCALLAKTLATSLQYPDPEEAYLAGLMHDIGALALSAIDPNGYPRLMCLSQDEEYLSRFELARYQATHVDVGTWLAESWQMNSFLSDSIRYHHVPAERVATAHPLIRIVFLANRLMQIAPASEPGEIRELARLCGAPAEIVSPSVRRADVELDRIAREYGISNEMEPIEPEFTSTAVASRNGPIGELETRLAEKLLIDNALSPLLEDADFEAVLKGIAQSVMVLFGLQPSIFFLREGESETFAGRAWLRQHAKVNQLKFLTGQADSAACLATLGKPTMWFVSDSWQKLLDAQLARLLNADGIVCIPLGAGSQCKGVMVSAINSQHHADVLHEKIDMLRSFGKSAGKMLEKTIGDEKSTVAPVPIETGASREQIRHLLHEVSNPLSIVRNYLSVLDTSLEKNAGGKKELRIVAEEIDRVAQILNRFQETPAQPPLPTGPIALPELVQGILDLCEGSRLVLPSVKIETRFHASPPAFIANPDKLKQALLNLLKNAFEAMPDGGTLRVATSPWSSSGVNSHVELMIEDSGPGLPEEIQRNIFQPVSSTKGGQHYGIGLSIAAQLIRELTGLISCHSDQHGCRFRIILPVVTR